MSSIDYAPTRAALYSPESHHSVFSEEKDYSGLQIAIEAARLAYVRAEESDQEADRLRAAMRRVGFDSLQILRGEATDTHAFGAVREDASLALLAFRGTRPEAFDDFITDVRLRLVDWQEAGGRVHEGFAKAFRAIRPDVDRWLKEQDIPIERLICTGHSLGAALATLAASVWKPSSLVTIGSPRVGNAKFIESLKEINAVRIVDCCDLVTDIPPELGGYRHTGSLVYITSDGEVRANPSAATIALDRAKADREYFSNYTFAIENVPLRRLADHAPINYVRAFLP